MTGYDTWPAFRHLAADVAAQLGERRGETWTVQTWHDGHSHPAADLAPAGGHGPEHARIYMQYGWDAAGKVTVKGLWPDGGTHQAPSRNVDPARGARAIAQAIDTYILGDPYAYLALLPGKAAAKQRMEERDALLAGIMARFAAALETGTPDDGKLSLSPYLPMRGELSLTGMLGTGPPAVSLEMHGLDVDTALRMVEVLAASDQARGRCCADFGAGHDPRLARLGCRRATREGRPTWREGDALYGLYRQSGTAQTWEDWLGPDAAAIHEARR